RAALLWPLWLYQGRRIRFPCRQDRRSRVHSSALIFEAASVGAALKLRARLSYGAREWRWEWMTMRKQYWLCCIGIVTTLTAASAAEAQPTSARDALVEAAAAMGGLERLQSLDNLVMTGFGQYINQQGGSAPSPDPRAPYKWTVAHDAERIFDLRNERALN